MIEKIKKKIEELLTQGEDKVEMDFWLNILEDLEEKDQGALLFWLERELEDLKALA